jgi:hypothetical protein
VTATALDLACQGLQSSACPYIDSVADSWREIFKSAMMYRLKSENEKTSRVFVEFYNHILPTTSINTLLIKSCWNEQIIWANGESIAVAKLSFLRVNWDWAMLRNTDGEIHLERPNFHHKAMLPECNSGTRDILANHPSVVTPAPVFPCISQGQGWKNM